MRRRLLLYAVYLIGFQMVAYCQAVANDSLRIVSYNVENLFHPERDSVNPDEEFTPEGTRKWTYPKYRNKIDRIAQVIVNIGQWEGVDLIGLCEVESRQCMEDIREKLKRFKYEYIHFDSPDQRGIDVALLYRKSFRLLAAYPILVALGEETTRDILYAQGVYNQRDTLHVFVCHLPSQRGGSSATKWKRERAREVLQGRIDSVLHASPGARIVVMGDMNTGPEENLRGMHNMMLPMRKTTSIGTYKYQGIWSVLDQFYLSDTLLLSSSVRIYAPDWLLEEDARYLGVKPRRTFPAYRYQDGYSDHLPIVLTIGYE